MIPLNGVLVDVEAARKAVAEFDEAAKKPVFRIGDWVVRPDCFDGAAVLVVECPAGFTHWGTDGRVWVQHKQHVSWSLAENLRHATHGEIAAATRIEPKVGMLLEDKSGVVWIVIGNPHEPSNAWLRKTGCTKGNVTEFYAQCLSTESYTIRDSVTIQGVR